MGPSHLLPPLGRLWRCFRREERGVAAVEFAVLLPFMIMLLIGTFEVTDALRANRKLTMMVRTAVDIVARQQRMDGALQAAIGDYTKLATRPYDATVQARLTSVRINAAGTPFVDWSVGYGSMAPHERCSLFNALPANLRLPNTSLVLMEGQLTYRPMVVGTVVGTIPMQEELYMRPRQGAPVENTAQGPLPPCAV